MAGVKGVLVLAITTLAVVFSATYVLRSLESAPEGLPTASLMAGESAAMADEAAAKAGEAAAPERFGGNAPQADPVHEPPVRSRIPVPNAPPEMDRDWPAFSATPVSSEPFAGMPALPIAPPLPPPVFLLADADLGYRTSVQIEAFAREPLVRVEARYPNLALKRDMEGHALLEYTVTDAGTVRDIAVIDTSHALFADSARDAVSRYLYEPSLIAGSPVDVSGVRMRIEFVLAERTR